LTGDDVSSYDHAKGYLKRISGAVSGFPSESKKNPALWVGFFTTIARKG
jgi:hypothetical protein